MILTVSGILYLPVRVDRLPVLDQNLLPSVQSLCCPGKHLCLTNPNWSFNTGWAVEKLVRAMLNKNRWGLVSQREFYDSMNQADRVRMHEGVRLLLGCKAMELIQFGKLVYYKPLPGITDIMAQCGSVLV